MDEYLLDSCRNVIRTNGVDIDFLFKKMRATRDEPTPADFKDWLEYRGDGVTIWGVDPGVTDMFVAVDDVLPSKILMRAEFVKQAQKNIMTSAVTMLQVKKEVVGNAKMRKLPVSLTKYLPSRQPICQL